MHPEIADRTSNQQNNVNRMNRISELPDELLLLILSLLPSKVAVVTCVLSKRWKSLWKYVTKLDYHYQKSGRTLLRLSPQFVYRFLLSRKFWLLESMRLIVDSECKAIDLIIWINFAVNHGLRELELDPFLDIGLIQLPRSLYACETLQILKLKNFVDVKVPRSLTLFKSLKILNLQLVYYKDEDSVRRLFSNCPCLEELFVLRYFDNVVKFTIEVPTLKKLSIHDFSDGDGRRGYVINAPSLSYLTIKGLKDFEFSLENTPELKKAKIDVSGINTEKIFLPLASSVKCMSISLSPVEIDYSTNIIFHELAYLELNTSKTNWCELLMILLLNSPNLQVLKLRGGDEKDSKERVFNSQLDQVVYVPHCLLFNLQIFEWERYNGLREEERQVATYILTNAKILNKARFSSKSSSKNDKLEMLKELAREPNASPSCHLFFE